MNPFLQPNGSATVVLDDQNLEPLNLDAGGNSSDMVAIQIGRMLSGDIRATHQEHNRLQFSSDHHHNPAMDVNTVKVYKMPTTRRIKA
ncbi:hypothetical protein BGX31_005373 [Mortierella sp. GBA43]|nr:hypothetical protein BGX31_005373 [Mortierella sp. GBA43]